MRFRDVRIVGLTASFQMHQSARESGRYSLSTAAAPAASVGGSAREREQSPARAGESRPRRARESGPRRTRVSGPRRARELSPPNARGTRSGAGWPSGPPSGSGTNCRPYRQHSVHQSARADERARMRSVHQSARADERRARTNVSPDERGGGNAASSEVARRIRAPAVITLVELATGLAVCSPGGRSASSPEARPRVGRRLVVGQDPPIALRAGAVRPQYRQLSDASRATPRASPGVIR